MLRKFFTFNFIGEFKRRNSVGNLPEPPDSRSDSEDDETPQPPDLIQFPPRLLTPLPNDDMGQKTSHINHTTPTKPKLSLTWVLRNHNNHQTTHTPHPEQPIKFQYKTRRKSVENNNEMTNKVRLNNELNTKVLNVPVRTKSEPSLNTDRAREKQHRHHKKRSSRSVKQERLNRFGYEINDVDAFLTKASIEKPANIPVVLSHPSVLYQTRLGGYQAEISLPLGMVVNAVFKNQQWLYVQTPHAEEGYVSYAACLPLGILPPRPRDSHEPALPCWEKNTDIFPKPCGNQTDTEKLSSRSECSAGRCRSRRRRNNRTDSCDEKSVDTLYLRATARREEEHVITRQTLLVIGCDYVSCGKNTLSVVKGDVVALVSAKMTDWFWVRARDGTEGFIPAAVAGHGFL